MGREKVTREGRQPVLDPLDGGRKIKGRDAISRTVTFSDLNAAIGCITPTTSRPRK